MIHRRAALRNGFLAPLGFGLAVGFFALPGCERKPNFAPLSKGKDETQKDSELLPGIERVKSVRPAPKKKR